MEVLNESPALIPTATYLELLWATLFLIATCAAFAYFGIRLQNWLATRADTTHSTMLDMQIARDNLGIAIAWIIMSSINLFVGTLAVLTKPTILSGEVAVLGLILFAAVFVVEILRKLTHAIKVINLSEKETREQLHTHRIEITHERSTYTKGDDKDT